MILTPPNTHLDLVRQAAAAGKHILLEKPLEISIERAEALVAAAEEAGVTLGVVLQHRFRPASRALGAMLAEGRLGEIVSALGPRPNWRPQSYYDQPGRGTKARDGGGVLLTQAIHTLDLMISLAGLPVEVTAYAATSAVHRMETEDLAMRRDALRQRRDRHDHRHHIGLSGLSRCSRHHRHKGHGAAARDDA